MMRHIILVLLVFESISCTISERPINYGTDECAYCKMIIMDHRYGSELVTDKGKVYTFDAAECLIDFMHYNEELVRVASMILVTPYTDPNMLHNAMEASYLVSGKMPSPMGAYLNSFKDLKTAREFQSTNGGEIYTWDELYANLKSIRLKAIQEYE
jgi:copper chaperone NosL